MNGLVIIFALGLNTHTCDIYVPVVCKMLWTGNEYFYEYNIFICSILNLNFSLNGAIFLNSCLLGHSQTLTRFLFAYHTTNFGEYSQALTLLIKH